MRNLISGSPRWSAVVALLATLALPVASHAQVGNAANPAIPTLDGVGLATMAGALSVGGAWLLSRNRNKRK